MAWGGVHSWGVEGAPGGEGCDLRWGGMAGGGGAIGGRRVLAESGGNAWGGGHGLEWGPEIASSAALYLIFEIGFLEELGAAVQLNWLLSPMDPPVSVS